MYRADQEHWRQCAQRSMTCGVTALERSRSSRSRTRLRTRRCRTQHEVGRPSPLHRRPTGADLGVAHRGGAAHPMDGADRSHRPPSRRQGHPDPPQRGLRRRPLRRARPGGAESCSPTDGIEPTSRCHLARPPSRSTFAPSGAAPCCTSCIGASMIRWPTPMPAVGRTAWTVSERLPKVATRDPTASPTSGSLPPRSRAHERRRLAAPRCECSGACPTTYRCPARTGHRRRRCRQVPCPRCWSTRRSRAESTALNAGGPRARGSSFVASGDVR